MLDGGGDGRHLLGRGRSGPPDGQDGQDGSHELAIANERFRSLFDHNADGVFSLTLGGRFDAVNPAGEALCGYREAELAQMLFTDLLLPEEVDPVARAFALALQREPQHLETRIRHREGRVVELKVTGVPIVVRDEVVGIFGVSEDVTERNRLQRELEAARRSAEAANEAKTLFLANISHEIRTPLTSCLAAAELLADSDLDAHQRRLTEVLARSGTRLLRLVDELLDFSRVEAGATTLEAVELDLREVLAEAVAPARAEARRKGLPMEVEVDADLPQRAVGDPVRICQVLTNLLDNAVKFTETGRVRVTAGEWPTDLGTGLVVVVRDTGIGMTAEQVSHVFEPFSQADATITRRYGGTGLGLAICRRLVDLMSGTLEVRSTPGEGTTVVVRLPLGRPA